MDGTATFLIHEINLYQPACMKIITLDDNCVCDDGLKTEDDDEFITDAKRANQI